MVALFVVSLSAVSLVNAIGQVIAYNDKSKAIIVNTTVASSFFAYVDAAGASVEASTG